MTSVTTHLLFNSSPSSFPTLTSKMKLRDLIAWQWDDYSRAHRSRSNLIIHIVAVPVFLLSNIALVLSIMTSHWKLAAVFFLAMLTAFAVQGIGHSKEDERPAAFSSPWNMVLRTFLEQWVTFPRFVLSGGWFLALRSAA